MPCVYVITLNPVGTIIDIGTINTYPNVVLTWGYSDVVASIYEISLNGHTVVALFINKNRIE